MEQIYLPSVSSRFRHILITPQTGHFASVMFFSSFHITFREMTAIDVVRSRKRFPCVIYRAAVRTDSPARNKPEPHLQFGPAECAILFLFHFFQSSRFRFLFGKARNRRMSVILMPGTLVLLFSMTISGAAPSSWCKRTFLPSFRYLRHWILSNSVLFLSYFSFQRIKYEQTFVFSYIITG